jgi:hypothetical protein
VRILKLYGACVRLAAVATVCALGLFAPLCAQTSADRGAESLAGAAAAQQQSSTAAAPSTTRESEMECSGFIEHRPPAGRLEIVGSEEEQEQRIYAEGDYVYINGGAQSGVRAGQEFSVIRPRGRFKTRLSPKSGALGMYTQELGRLRVVSVKQNVSVALVMRSCDNMLLGDLLRELPARPAPVVRAELPLERFAEPSGKQQGRIVLARDGREALSKDEVVFIDLGAEDNVKAGDYLTIYRPLGKGTITHFEDKEITSGGSRSFENSVFRGGKFSNKAQRVKDPVDGHYKSITNSPAVISRRPSMPRKIVGEVIIISVEQRTAAAVITRHAQEIHTGDYVEVQ